MTSLPRWYAAIPVTVASNAQEYKVKNSVQKLIAFIGSIEIPPFLLEFSYILGKRSINPACRDLKPLLLFQKKICVLPTYRVGASRSPFLPNFDNLPSCLVILAESGEVVPPQSQFEKQGFVCGGFQ